MPAPFSISIYDMSVTTLHSQSCVPRTHNREEAHTFCHEDFGHCSRLHPTLPLKSSIDADFNELDGLPDFMAETVLVSNAIGEICVGI